MFKKNALFLLANLFIFGVVVSGLYHGIRANTYYVKYIDDVADVRAVVVRVTEEYDGEDTSYHIDAQYEYDGTIYGRYIGRYGKKYDPGEVIDIKVLRGDPGVVFEDESGAFPIVGAVAMYCVFMFFMSFTLEKMMREKRRKEIDSKQIYLATKSGNLMSVAAIFTMLTISRIIQIHFYPRLIITDIDKWINCIIPAVAVISWLILFIRVKNYSVSGYNLITDVCFEKYKDDSGDSTVCNTTFNCGESKNPVVYENVNQGKSCYVLTDPRGKILAAYDIDEWGSPVFSANDFDYKREYCKDIVLNLLYSVAATAGLMVTITVIGIVVGG